MPWEATGAREAQVARYIDGALMLAERRDLFVVGLEATDEYAQSTFGATI